MLTRTDWATIKQVKSTNSFSLYYSQDGAQYSVVEGNRLHQYWAVIKESADVTEFVTSYIGSATSVLSVDDAISRILINDPGVLPPNAATETTLQDVLAALGGGISSNIAGRLYLCDTGRVTTGEGDATLNKSDTPMLLIVNPSGSGKTLKLWTRTYGVCVTNVMARFRLFVNPTVTANGTSLSVTKARQTMGSTVANAYLSPTVSSLGTLIDTFVVAQNNSGYQTNANLTLWLEPGNSWLIGSTPSSNGREVDICVNWIEES